MYSHLLEISEPKRRLVIYRVYPDGRKELFTEIALPNSASGESSAKFKEFCHMLGENLLLDSPQARKLLGM